MSADAAQDHVFDAAEAYTEERTPALRRVLSERQRVLKELEKDLRELRTQRDTLTTASVKDRLKAVDRVLTQKVGVAETNTVLRDAIRRIVLDPTNGRLWIRWQHSEEIQDIGFASRHMDWTPMREIQPPMHALFPERNGEPEER